MESLAFWGLLTLAVMFSDAQDDLTLIDPNDNKAYQISKTTGVWHARDLPSPQTTPELCGRGNTPSLICDPNGIISKDEADDLDRIASRIYNDTTCPCSDCIRDKRGYMIMIGLIPEMHRPKDAPKDVDSEILDARRFAYGLSQIWHIGSCEEAIIVLYARRNDVVYTITKKNARVRLPDDNVRQITMQEREFFVNGRRVAEGLKRMLLDYREVIRGTYVRRTPLPPPETAESVGGTDQGATIYTILNTIFALSMAIVCSLNM